MLFSNGIIVEKPKVFICPQHWGLGHVTRTIPVVHYFIEKGFPVILGSSGAGSELLKKEFPDLKLYELPDYGIRYPFKNMYVNMGLQLLQMHWAIVKEYFSVRKICKQEKIGLIVSDARLGAAQKKIPSVIITHHLHFPLRNRFFEWVSDVWMRFFYLRFNQIWVPDLEGENNLSGSLSHKFKSSKHYFIGIPSRFKRLECNSGFDYAIILSGPEPQRSQLELILLKQIKELFPAKIILVRGTNRKWQWGENFNNYAEFLTILNLVSGAELNKIMSGSGFIICRSGYTSLLDLSVIGKNALLIPTPGQPEQEYLAEELKRKGIFYSVTQDEIQLKSDLLKASSFNGIDQIQDTLSIDKNLDKLLVSLLSTG